ncbi:tetratricopeptide repeat-containing sulfotransferase family protein [Aliikangiella coralliicola]|uniref:tetratricopeptide repeat-containing sulfotransferase family protein n=1 Tax=Aliikangiella coralliicola TaxID=2592383 RepID=UPI00143DE772|nr:sulfotransferase [Aliikangiella coralliicola]
MDQYKLIRQAILNGKNQVASKEIEQLLIDRPEDKEVWRLLAEFGERVYRRDICSQAYKKILELDQNDLHAIIGLGMVEVHRGNRAAALGLAERALKLSPSSPWLLDGLATLFTGCDEASRALALFENAARLLPDNPAILYNLATSQRMNGQFIEAEDRLNQVIKLRPQDADAYYVRASLRQQTLENNHVDEIKTAINRKDINVKDKIKLYFAAAKELEDLEDYSQSFQYLEKGCDLQRNSMDYDALGDVETIDKIITHHNVEGLSINNSNSNEKSSYENSEPIFVFGLPRSGTTLVERIIASHSQVFAAGELNAFPQAAVNLVNIREGRHFSKQEFVQQSLHIDPFELGKAYLAGTRPQTGHTPHFVDKLPLNYLYAGLIRRALPNAKMIVLIREPMDSCYAMYKMLFTGAYPFTYNLRDLALYYSAWRRLIKHWQKVLGNALLVVKYEELVNHQETISRRILDHCGLSWEEQCLHFYQNDATVTTASACQVRSPIYGTSVGKWRNYEKELQPLKLELTKHGVLQ